MEFNSAFKGLRNDSEKLAMNSFTLPLCPK